MVAAKRGMNGAEVSTDDRGTWIVLLEAVSDGDGSPVDMATVKAILVGMGHEDAVGLHASARLAVQVRVDAADVAAALSEALARWRSAAAGLARAGWLIVRAEVLTPEEFRRDFEANELAR